MDLGEFTREKEPLLYKLQGVVAHDGTLKAGHYIAAVRQLEGIAFRTINDDEVRKISTGMGNVTELKKPGTLRQDFDPCILFYSKFAT
ncbi:uncharacterized protein LTR77_002641 [Saxophila tyrrhenica]|uniref:USP domain-containing protein n=1 Tax=Saxophila tyrrhenica TaxID=1690608 RepID=A0AAV9PF96_9PEZI|nr:hypothetical protein LTR77_002641 [Saxophila tyrrhenica]